jgi:hypothetical protein
MKLSPLLLRDAARIIRNYEGDATYPAALADALDAEAVLAGVEDHRHEWPNVEPVLRWMIPNPIRGYAPVLAQGFPGVWEGREDQHYFPDSRIQYTIKLEHTFETLEEARTEALRRLAEARAKLDERETEIMAVTDR